jgi:anti-sigma regulatory factor (Ser/Thr protein kinase)
MGAGENRLRIPSLIEKVSVACEFVVDTAQRAGLDEHAVHHCQLVVDEACTNIIEHGYGRNDRARAIEITCGLEKEGFVITIVDDAPPFDPLNRPDPDPKSVLEERANGGWGVYFIKKLMDEVVYQYAGGRNHLTMVKRLDTPPGAG